MVNTRKLLARAGAKRSSAAVDKEADGLAHERWDWLETGPDSRSVR